MQRPDNRVMGRRFWMWMGAGLLINHKSTRNMPTCVHLEFVSYLFLLLSSILTVYMSFRYVLFFPSFLRDLAVEIRVNLMVLASPSCNPQQEYSNWFWRAFSRILVFDVKQSWTWLSLSKPVYFHRHVKHTLGVREQNFKGKMKSCNPLVHDILVILLLCENTSTIAYHSEPSYCYLLMVKERKATRDTSAWTY